MSNRAHQLHALDNFPEAIRLHMEAANYALEKIPDDQTLYAESLFHIAQIYFRLKQFRLAQHILCPAVEIYAKHLAPPPVNAANANMLMAHCLYARCRYSEAATHYEQAINLMCTVLPGWHPLVAQVSAILLRCRQHALAQTQADSGTSNTA